MIRCVLFDLGGVLLPFDRERRVSVMVDRLGVDAQSARTLMLGELPRRLDTGDADDADLAAAMSTLARRAITVEEAIELTLSVFGEPNYTAWAIASRLAQRVRVGGFSDNPGFVRRMIPSGHVLEPLFLSAELRAAKPSATAFAAVERQLAVEPASILFIDDTAANITAAQDRGWDGIVFTSNDALVEKLASRGLLT